METLNPWRTKYDELKYRADKILMIIESYDPKDEKDLSNEFKDFCIQCHSLNDWFEKSGINTWTLSKSNTYLDIIRGIANGEKHYKITKGKYKSPYYRMSTLTKTQSSTGLSDNSENPLHIDPEEKILIVETCNGVYGINDIVNGCIEAWSEIIEKHVIGIRK